MYGGGGYDYSGGAYGAAAQGGYGYGAGGGYGAAPQSYGGGYAATPAAPAAASGYGYGAPGGYQQVLPVQLWSLVNKEKDMARWSALRKSPRSRVKKMCADIWKKRKVLLVFTAVVPTLEVAIVCFLWSINFLRN
eukprot:EG_transcript_22139